MTQARNLGNFAEVASGSSNTNISFDSGLLYIDSVNNRIGFGTTTPSKTVDIVGNVSGNLVSGNVFSDILHTSKLKSAGDIKINVGGGANSISFLANGVLNVTGGVMFADGSMQTSKSGGGGLNSGVSQSVTAVANTIVDLSLGDVVDIDMATDIVNLSFTNAVENQIVLINLIFGSNTAYISNIANCTSSIAISAKDVRNSFELTTNNYGETWIYTALGGYIDSNRKILWSWGYNASGNLGQNDRTNRSSPTQVGSLTTWSQVAGGSNHSLALKTDGTLWSWGINYFGALGQDNITHRSSPTQVGSLTNWSQVASGFYHSIAIQ